MAASALDFTMKTIEHEDRNLADYKGKVVMIVNVASKCGLTPQYDGLQALHDKYADQGLAILGFPANEFAAQEPGSDEEILEFCTTNYGVDFDMFSKIVVKGDGMHPLYGFLTGADTNPDFSGAINWNFEKFLLDKNGRVVARFAPPTAPEAEEVVSTIERELAK
ncbi:MAG: glutathione peroxidase [Deltaproteobacteria bacterium]|nr:glutathione peroxidase [Deltaproteobacteria bacterium]